MDGEVHDDDVHGEAPRGAYIAPDPSRWNPSRSAWDVYQSDTYHQQRL